MDHNSGVVRIIDPKANIHDSAWGRADVLKTIRNHPLIPSFSIRSEGSLLRLGVDDAWGTVLANTMERRSKTFTPDK